MKEKRLTARQERFCQEFARSMRQTEAAIKAGYSKENADSIASRLVRKSQVQERLREIIGRRARRYDVSAGRVLKELARIAFSDIGNYLSFNESGVTMKESSDLTSAQRAAIQEVSQVMNQWGGTTKFKLHDKVKALELLGKHLKLFTEKHEHGVDSKLEDLIAGSMAETASDAAEKESEDDGP